MVEALGVSESGYYKWLQRYTGKVQTDLDRENRSLKKKITSIYFDSRGVFGSRKITRILNKEEKKRVNHKRVERIMREEYLFSRTRKRFLVTTNSNHHYAIAPNLLGRDFTAERPRTKLVSDTTEYQTKEGKFYIAVILDLYGRYPMGLAMSRRNNDDLVCLAFKDMCTRYKDLDRCIIHSDRGSTYASNKYQRLIKEQNMICSMSRKGDCWDNAPMESFFGKLKAEWLDRSFQTIEQAMKAVYEYTWYFYSRKRPHVSLDYLTPFEYYSTYTYTQVV